MKAYVWNPWQTAQLHPDRIAAVGNDGTYTFSQLTDRADRLGEGLATIGMDHDSMISTDIPTGPRFFALALAALKYGYGLFPVETGEMTAETVGSLFADMNVTMHVASVEAASLDKLLPCPVVTDTLLLQSAPQVALVAPAPRQRAGFLAFSTSGTTGAPQGVPRAHPWRPYKGVAVEERYAAGISFGPHIMAGPTYHLGTLGPALYALQAGSAVVVQRTWSPNGFADLADRFGADSAMLPPDCLLDVVEAGRAPDRRLRAVFHGGAACPPAVKRSAIELLGPVLHEYYGTSRGTITEITTAEWLKYPGSVGKPLPGVQVQIRRDRQEVPPGAMGEITVSLRPADLRSDDPAVLPTGDLGFVNQEGYLFIVGRLSSDDDVTLARLEYEVRLLPEVSDVAVMGGTTPRCFVEIRNGHTKSPEEKIRIISGALGIVAPLIKTAPTGSLPRTASGKIRRASLGDPFPRGED
ncbi:class I adenylate-forming enzyme family protein [Streptomyces pseudovenezuelae]|uniref:Long-chain acyl-CoA synthetase n=1 Tax=Streptomyces pseudovenezuelae TaxID=67350 RepID=A0ABT6M0K9_9ACTN|nr:class I adenylate-forming enzyme family protein [Streptomyces pseudovenezuelae]MDH6222090.1 long-chain acyl-CoA synthetase [Streptomyces pseudovenezuelae]